MLLLLKLEWWVRAGQPERRREDPLAGEHAGWCLLGSQGTDKNGIVRAPGEKTKWTGKKLQREGWAFRICVEVFGFCPNSNKNL